MKKIILSFTFLFLFTTLCFSQTKFSGETKKYIEYSDSVIVFKNGLLIDGKGNSAKTDQTIIISNGKINWVGDDTKAVIPTEAKTIDLAGKAIMPGLVMGA